MKRYTFFTLLLTLSLHTSWAQSEDTSRVEILLLRDTTTFSYPNLGLMPKEFNKPKGSVQVNGFYRFYATYTRQLQPYTLTAAL